MFRTNDPASPTPVADESGVVVFSPDFGLAAYTPDVKDRWDLALGPFQNFYGMACSPIVAGELLVRVCDQQGAMSRPLGFFFEICRKTRSRLLNWVARLGCEVKYRLRVAG